MFAIQRGNKPIDRGRAFGVQHIRIEHDFLRLEIVCRSERHQQRLLLWRLEFHREQDSRPRDERKITRRSFRVPLRQLSFNRSTVRQLVEILAGPLILRVRPRLHLGVIILFQPLIGIVHHRAGVFVRHRFLRSLWRGLDSRQTDWGQDS